MKFTQYILLFLLFTFHHTVFSSGWQFDSMKLNDVNKGFELYFNSIRTPFDSKPFQNIQFNCLTSKQIYPQLNCQGGELSFDYKQNHHSLLFSGWINFIDLTWRMTFFNSAKNIQLFSQSSHPNKFVLKLDNVTSDALAKLLNPYIDFDWSSVSVNISAQLEIDLSSDLVINADYHLKNLNWESEDGNYVLADTQLAGQSFYQQKQHGTSLTILSEFISGESLLENIYLQFQEAQITTHSELKFDENFNIEKHQLDINMDEVNNLNINLNHVNKGDLDIDFNFRDLKLLKAHELESFLEILGINDLDIEGQADGQVNFVNSQINSIDAHIQNVSLEIESRRTQALDLNSQLHWHRTGEWQDSVIGWEQLLIAGMPINSYELRLSSVGEKLQISPNAIIPVFDGSIIIRQLELTKVLQPQIDIIFDGEVTPISLVLITEKLNWPIMQGTISGKIPGMIKKGQRISFDGTLDINVFEGQMHIDHLSMERLFGIAPVIAADVTFTNLNLKQITSTYDFGEITGLIDGMVKGLRITNWKADRLETSIESVPNKNIKQTISQRAIDNISSIGGIQGALSRSFLRFFDSFKYKKIGIGCKLRNAICEMSGIQTADNTYKLIEGRGIPSINIIGFQKFIDWEVFLDRLLNAGY